MPLHLITAQNIRDPLGGLVDSIIQRHVSHRLQDDFLVLSPDETSNRDLIHHFLNDPRLEGVLTGSSLVSLSQWISHAAREIEPLRMAAPEWVHEALFRPLAQKIFQKASPASDLSRRLSIASLYQLIGAFREERLGAAELRSFVAAFDPELAEGCAELFLDYRKVLQSRPHTWDFSAEADRVLQGIERGEIAGLKRLQTLYWLGFTHPSPLLKALIVMIDRFLPGLEQILIVQIPQKIDAQDFISAQWGIQKEVYPFDRPSPPPETSLLCFPGPFDEAGYLLDEISKQVEAGIDPDRIGLFLPPDLFWEAYFSQELAKRGLLSRSLQRRPLGSFSKIASTCLETPAKALEITATMLKGLHSHFKEKNSESLALEIRALRQWQEELERVHFYQGEIPELQGEISLPRVASKLLLAESASLDRGVALRPHKAIGLKRFETTLAFQCTDRFLPQGPERFFGYPLPGSLRSPAGERALFQHLLGAAASRRVLSTSSHSAQGEESAASPYFNEFRMGELKAERHRPRFVSRGSPQDWGPRLEIERRREKDFKYENPYGGKIGEERVLQLFQEKMASHVYSASQLESYTQCPFKFFASVILRLKPPQEKTPDGTPADRGEWIHEFLERFFSENRTRIIEARHSPELQKELLSRIPERLKAFSSVYLEERPWIHEILSSDFISKTGETLQSLLKDLWERMNLSENPFLPAHFERTFGRGKFPPLHIDKKGLPPLRVAGRIDRIDVSADGSAFMVFDYKTGETANLSNGIKNFKSLQLPIYLKAAEMILSASPSPSCLPAGTAREKVSASGGRRSRTPEPRGALAISLKEMKISEGFVRKEEKNRLGLRARTALWEDETWDSFWENFEENLLKLQQRILSGDLRVQPDPCDAYCDFKTICRYHERAKPNT